MKVRSLVRGMIFGGIALALAGCGGGGGATATNPTTGDATTTFQGRIVNPGGGRASRQAPAKPASLGVVAVTPDGRTIRQGVNDDGAFSFDVPTGESFLLSFVGDADGDPNTGTDGLEAFEGAGDVNGDGTPDLVGTNGQTVDLGELTLPADPNTELVDLPESLGQFDTDGDGQPDAADPDANGNGTPDAADLRQLNSDDDPAPNVIDPDDDNDGVADDQDTDDTNDGVLDQDAPDTDGDGVSDAVDVDDDNDGIVDSIDADADGDGKDDSLALDSDHDGVPDRIDTDDDNDGTPDVSDNDDDNDGIPDTQEVDSDHDGLPDQIDPDDDNDGVPDAADADANGDGVTDANDPNLDTDYDGEPNVLDTDDDNDGAPDTQDSDTNNDGTPDASNPPTAAKPATLPTVRLYAETSPFNQEVDEGAPLDPNSATYVNALTQTLTQGIVVQVKQYSAPVYFADANTPRRDVSLVCGPAWQLGVSKMKNAPIPDYAEPANDVDGANNPVRPGVCGDNADQDNNMVIIDTTTGCEYDFWQARKVNDAWEASWGNVVSLSGTGVYATGLSARGSGFAFLAGVLWPGELQRGEIEHALVCNLPPELVRGGGPVAPATESDGETNSTAALPEGAHLRLDPSLDLDTLDLTPAEKTIAKAMQKYGLFVCDNGGAGSGAMGLYAVDPRSVTTNPYAGLWPDEDYVSLSHIPVNRLQVLQLPAQDPDFQQKLSLPTGGCAQFE